MSYTFLQNNQEVQGTLPTSVWSDYTQTRIVTDHEELNGFPAEAQWVADATIPHALKAVAGLYRLWWETTHPAPENLRATYDKENKRLNLEWEDPGPGGVTIARSTFTRAGRWKRTG